MNAFKRKALMSAVLASLGVAGTAEAVYKNNDGLGDVLLYPYYTVQSNNGNAFNTYMSVVNTTADAKVVKVRFREGKTSVEVLDFNLYLSPNDVWTAAIIPASSDASAPARLITADRSCTNPPIPAGGVDFRNFLYLTGGDALPGTGLERTREGYFEILEMATLTGTSRTNVTHNSAGVPVNCAAVQGTTVALTITAPTGGLAGQATLINVNNGQDFTYNADALAEFQAAPFYTDIANDLPNLSSADPFSVVISGRTVYRSDWIGSTTATAGAQAVSAVYMHSAVINEYVLDAATASQTDWVFTFPTKRLFVTSATVDPPFTNLLTASGACETIGFTFFNREEQSTGPSGVDFSPFPPGAAANSLCWESTVMSMRNGSNGLSGTTSGVLGSANTTAVTITTGFQNGWAAVTFAGANASAVGMGSPSTVRYDATNNVVAGPAPATYFGLPVTGFAVRTFANGSLTCSTGTCQGNYGGLFDHAYRRRIAP